MGRRTEQRKLVQRGLRAFGLALAFAASGALAAVGVNKTFNPTNVSAGQSSTLTVILLNNNVAAATAVAFTDNLPGTVVVANPANASTTCGAVVTAIPGANNFSVTGGTIPAAAGGVAGQCTAQVDVVSPASGVFINNIPAGAVSSSQGTNPQNANATLTVAALRPVTGAKAFAPANLHGGGTASTVTLTLTNPNSVALTGAALTDTLPAGLAIAAPPNTSTTCGAGTVTTGANTASLAAGTIPANGSCIVRFNVVASNPNVFVDGNVTNTIAAGALSATQGVTNTVFAANVRLQTGARLEKTFAPTPIATGGTSTLTVTVRNFNATPLAGIAFSDAFPGTMRVAAPVTTGGTCTPPLAFTPAPLAGDAGFTVSGGTLPAAPAGIANASCTVTINVTATNPGVNPITLTNPIPAGNFGGVAFPAASGNLVVNAVSTVGGSKSFAPTPILQGGVSTLTITLTNSAAVPAAITAFTDALTTLGANPQFTVAAAPPATTTCGGVLNAAPGASTITLGAGNSIPAAGSCTITVPVQASAIASTGARTNTIAQGALQTSQGRTQAAISGVLTVNPVLSVAKVFAPLTVAAGTDSRTTITLTRAAGAVALTGLAFTDTLPAGHLVSATPNLVNNCGGAVTATSGANTVSLAGGSLAGGAVATSCTILVNITTPAGTGSGTNTIAAGAVSSAEGFVNAAAASATVTRVVTAVTINKSFNPATVLVGGVSQLTINIINTNANAIALTAGALTDNFPVGMVVAAAPGATNNCGGTFTPVAGATSVSLTNASIAANTSCRVQVNVVANAAGNLINPLGAGAFTSAQGVTNPLPASATLAATGVANLGVSKTDGVASVVPGTSTTYTIVASNAGPNAVAGASVVDNPPAGVTFTSWTCVASAGSACGNASGSGPINELISLLNAGTATYTVTAAVAPGATGTIANTVTVNVPPTVVDPTPGNNTATDTDTLTPVASLGISKTDGSATYTPGGTATYTVVVMNAGPSNATGVTVSDPLPAGVTLSANVTCVAAGAASCGAVTGTTGQTSFGTTGATIAAGAGNSLTFNVPVLFASGMLTNPLVNTVTATDPSSPPAGAADSDARLAVAALAVTKTDGSATYTPGGTATYTVTVTNAGPSNANNVTVSDPLPAGVTLNANATCVASGTANCGAVTGTAGQTSFGTTAATIAAGAANKLVFTVPVAFASSMVTNPMINTATATDPASAPATGSDSDARTAVAALAVAKTDGSATYTPGNNATYNVVVTNTGPSHASSVTVTDPLPAGVTLSANATCVASGGATCGVVTGTTGQTSFGTTGATIAAGAGNQLTFTVPIAFAPAMTTNPLVNTATATDPSSPPATALDSDTLAAQVALNVVKTDGSATYAPGGTAMYTITVTNGGPSSATNVTITDPLPAGVTLTANATCVATGAANCGTVTGTTGQNAFGSTGASVGPGAANKLVFTVPVAFATSMVADPIINSATATDVASTGPGSTATGTDTDSRSATVALNVVKTDGSATYTPGGTATYTVTVTNGGPSLATNLTVTDVLPAGVTLTASVTCAASGTATCGTVTGTTGQTTFGATGATLGAAAGDALMFTVPVAFASSMTIDPLINAATATDLGSSGPGSSATGSDSDTRSAAVTLLVTKTDGATTYTPGGTATYTVTIENTGTSDALDVTVTDALPAGVTLSANAICVANGSSNCGAVTGTTGQTSFGTTGAIIVSGGANTITFTIPVAFAAGMSTNPLVNMATATDVPTSATANGSDSDTLSSNVTLAVVKTDGSATYTPGGTATYTVTVANTGLSDALNVSVTDALPAGVTLSANVTCAPNGSSTCGTVNGTTGQTSFSATAARVDAGGANTLVFTVPVAFAAGMAIDPLVNTASATDVASGNTANGSDSDTLSAAVTLGVAKTDGSATYTPGGTATYTVTVTNSGLSDALNVTVTDPLPAGVTLSANATCLAGGTSSCGTVTGTTGQTSFGTTTARVDAGAANAIVFTVPVAFAAGMTTTPLINMATATDLPSGITANGSDSDVLSTNVSLSVAKTDGSSTYTPGGAATYTVTVANTGVTDALNVTVNDPLPAGVTLGANATCVANGSSSCGTVTGTTGQTAFGTTAARVDAGGANTLVFTAPVAFAAAMSTNPLVNTATATDVSSGATANGSDSDSLAASVVLAVSKTDGSATYTPGGTATYVVTVSNSGVSNALDVTVADPLPAGVTLSANATCVASGTSNCGTVTGTTGQTSFGTTGARVDMGAGNTLVFTVPVTFAAGMSTNPLVNIVTATDLGSGASANGTDSDALVGAAGLAITKTDGSATYTPGGTAMYTVVVTNGGPSNATNTAVTDNLPAGVTLSASATCVATGAASCGTVTGASGATSFGTTGATIAAGAGNQLTFTVPVSFSASLVTDPLVNTVSASDPSAPVPVSASDSDARVAAVADVGIVKTGPATLIGGGAVTYTLTITNSGPSVANGATFNDNVPGVVTGVTASCGSAAGGAACGTVTVIGNNVSGTVPLLPVGGSVVITITGNVAAGATGSVTNIGTVSPPLGIFDPNPANASSSATTNLSAPTVIQVPVNAPWALALLLLAVGMLGARASALRRTPRRY